METTVEQLIKERAYASLTGEELQSVSELCETEEEFQSMKQFFQELEGVAASEKTIIHPEVKQSLDSIFSAKFPGIHANWTAPETAAAPEAPVIPLHQRTWVRIAAVGLIVLGTAPFWSMLKTDEAPGSQKEQFAGTQTPQAIETQPMEETSGASLQTEQPAKSEEKQLAGLYEDDAVFSDKITAYDGTYSTGAETMTVDAAAAPVTYSWSPSVAAEMAKPVQYGAVTHVTAANFNAIGTDSRKLSSSFSNEGRLADLHPDGLETAVGEVSALSLAEQPDDLLDLLSPAF